MDILEELKKQLQALDVALSENRARHYQRAWGLVLTAYESTKDLIREVEVQRAAADMEWHGGPTEETLEIVKRRAADEQRIIHAPALTTQSIIRGGGGGDDESKLKEVRA